MDMRKVNTYGYYKGRAFVAAQIQRRKCHIWKKSCPDKIMLTTAQIEQRYHESIEVAKEYAREMRRKWGKRIDVEN